jgi:hypothetical protein
LQGTLQARFEKMRSGGGGVSRKQRYIKRRPINFLRRRQHNTRFRNVALRRKKEGKKQRSSLPGQGRHLQTKETLIWVNKKVTGKKMTCRCSKFIFRNTVVAVKKSFIWTTY